MKKHLFTTEDSEKAYAILRLAGFSASHSLIMSHPQFLDKSATNIQATCSKLNNDLKVKAYEKEFVSKFKTVTKSVSVEAGHLRTSKEVIITINELLDKELSKSDSERDVKSVLQMQEQLIKLTDMSKDLEDIKEPVIYLPDRSKKKGIPKNIII